MLSPYLVVPGDLQYLKAGINHSEQKIIRVVLIAETVHVLFVIAIPEGVEKYAPWIENLTLSQAPRPASPASPSAPVGWQSLQGSNRSMPSPV